MTAVAARGATFDGPGADESHRVIVVAIRQDDRGFAGAFQLRDDRIATNKREVHGLRCDEVVDALAVVTAIALRPNVAAGGPLVADVSPLPATLVAPPPPAAKPVAEAPDEGRLRARTEIFPPRREKLEIGAGTLRFDLQRSYSLYAGAVVGLVPSVVIPRYDLSYVAAHFVTTPEGAQRIAGLVFQVRLSGLGPATYRSADTTTALAGLSFGIGLCQSPLYDTRRLVLLFCGEYGGGLMKLTTKGLDGSQIQSKSEGFGTVGLGAEIQYNFGSIFQVGAKVGGGFNVGNITAERADGSRIFGPSIWSTYALLGIGIHF